MRRIVVRCDGGTDLGMGHVVRCVALSEMLAGKFEILFVLQETGNSILQFLETNSIHYSTIPRTTDFEVDSHNLLKLLKPGDIVVLDGYHFKTAYQEKIKSAGHRLIVIDDLHSWHHVADIVINHADGIKASDYDCEPYTKLCLGLDYLLIRSAFLQYKRTLKEVDVVRTCLISMGAADTANLTHKFADILLRMSSIEQIILLVSDVNPHLSNLENLRLQHPDKIFIRQNLSAEKLAEQIRQVDVVICPASSISLEACAVGSIVLTGTTAENQKANAKGLIENGMVINLGDLNNLSKDDFIKNLETIEVNPEIANILIQQKNKLDGLSGQRILETIMGLDHHESFSISFRKPNEDDLMLYFNWTNEPEVRKNSFDSSPISLATHEKWFLKTIHSADTLMLLFSNDQQPVGQLRFIIENEQALLNYSIDSAYRGKGLARIILRESVNELIRLRPEVNSVIAEVKPENVASIKSFERLGFIIRDISPTKIVFRFPLKPQVNAESFPLN